MHGNRRVAWAFLGLCAAVSFLAFAYPMYVIRPFRAQGARELAVALVVRSWGPPVAAVAAVFALGVFAFLWQRTRWGARITSFLLMLLAVGFAGLSRINVYERMFSPIPSVEYFPAATAGLESDDMVMGVKVGDHARAYPVRMMGYHHVVNDWVGGVPLVGTY